MSSESPYIHLFQQRVRRLFRSGLVLGLIAIIVISDTDVTKIVPGITFACPLIRCGGCGAGATLRASSAKRGRLCLKRASPSLLFAQTMHPQARLRFTCRKRSRECLNHPIVYCWGADQPRTEFYFWPEYNYPQRIGDNAIYVNVMEMVTGKSDPKAVSELPPDKLVRQFRSVKNTGTVHADFRGRPVRWLQLFECRDQLAEISPTKADQQALKLQ